METKPGNTGGYQHPFSFCLVLIFVSISIGLSLESCQKRPPQLLHVESNYKVGGTRMNVSPEDFVYPNRLHRMDSLLLVEDSDKTNHFRIVNLNSLSVYAVGKMGNGPGELTFPTSIQILPNSSRIGLCIRPKFIFGEFTLNDLLRDSLDKFETSKRFDINQQKVVKVNDSLFVSIGLFKKRYALFNQHLKLVSEQHDYPFIEKFPNTSTETIGMAYQGDIAVKPDGTRIVAVTSAAIHFQILMVSGYQLIPVKTISLTHPIFRAGEENTISATMLKENVYGFLDVSVTDESVYLLFSGKTAEDNRTAGSAARTVLVYSWDGESKYKLDLDRDVVCIAADEDKKVIYAFEFGANPTLVYFPLPEKTGN